MSVAKNVEISAQSTESFEAAIQEGIQRTSKSVEGIESAWIKEQKVVVEDGKVTGFRVDMKVTFVVHD
ncbi:MAG: dodecin family protein [Phycisphaerae bacterium]